jgi:thioredoxin-related protein
MAGDTYAQTQQPAPVADTRLPCQKTLALPVFKIILTDTSKSFNTADIPTGKKSVFIIFGPECSHCRDFFRRLFVGIDTLKTYDFYLVTPIRNPNAFASFYSEFKIADYKNIKVAGRDLDFFVMDYFGIRKFPSLVLYDEHKNFVRGLDGDAALTELHD